MTTTAPNPPTASPVLARPAVHGQLIEACFSRAMLHPVVQATHAVFHLETTEISGLRFRRWLQQQIQSANALGEDHPFWDALVQEGFDSRWIVEPAAHPDQGQGKTVLHVCCDHDLIDPTAGLARAFARHGHTLEAPGGTFHETPLALTVRLGGLAVANALLEAGADPCWVGPDGSLLWLATLNDRRRAHGPALVKALLAKGGRKALDLVDVAGDNGLTPLHNAVQGDRVPAVQILLQAGADPRRPNPDGRSVREVAQGCGDVEVCRLIEQRWVAIEREALQAVLQDGPAPTAPARPARRL